MSEYTDNLRTILQTMTDPVVVCEFYPSDQAPDPSDGFDPNDAVKCYAPVGGVTFQGVDYTRLVKDYGTAKRTITPEINSHSLTLKNLSNEASDYELTTGFEGMIYIVRLISRSLSSALTDSYIIFTGRLDQAGGGNKEDLSLTAKHILGSIDVNIPRRQYTSEDEKGRHFSDVLFEGFRFMPRYSTFTYTTRERRGGFLGLFGFKKDVTKTVKYSSYSDLDAEKFVPEAGGRVQLAATHIAYFDLGSFLLTISAFCEGKILAYTNTRSEVPGFYLGGQVERFGDLGGVGSQVPNPDTRFDPFGNGYYSRLAYCYFAVNGSEIATVDPAPTIASVLLAKLFTVPDGSGDWVDEAWSDNGTAHIYWFCRSADYFNLSSGWMDEEAALESYNYNNEFIFDRSLSDIIFTPDSTSYSEAESEGGGIARLFPSTALGTPEYFKYLNGDKAEDETFYNNPPNIEYTKSTLPEEDSIDPTDFPTNGTGGGQTANDSLSFFVRRRYTSNWTVTDEMSGLDFIHEVLGTSSRLYLSQNPKGQIQIKNKKPADWALLTAAASSGTSLSCDDVSKWISNQYGVLLIDPHQTVSEIRTVTSAAFSTDQNSVTLSASANIGVVGFSGCDGASAPATATLTVNSVAASSFTLDSIQIDFAPGTNDTTKTIAGFLRATINGHPTLNRKFFATWDTDTAVVTITAKFGSLTLASAIENAHIAPATDPTTAPTLGASGTATDFLAGTYYVGYSFVNGRGETLLSAVQSQAVTATQQIDVTGVSPPAGFSVNWFCSPAANSRKMRFYLNNDGSGHSITTLPKMTAAIPVDTNRTGTEVIRCAAAFTDRELTRTDLARSNVLKGTFEWSLAQKEKPTNRVDVKFYDSTQDYRPVTLKLRDDEHIEKVGKVYPKSYNATASDSYNQAYRIASGLLAEHRDANFLYKWSSDREALLIQEGEICAITDAGSGVVNFPVRVEGIEFTELKTGFVKANFTARKYATTLYDDSVAERDIPVQIESEEKSAENKPETAVTLTRHQSSMTFTDEMSGTLLLLTLPAIQDGLNYAGHVVVGDGVRFIAPSGSTIVAGDSESADGGTIESTQVGSTIRLKCFGSEWRAVEITGKWEIT